MIKFSQEKKYIAKIIDVGIVEDSYKEGNLENFENWSEELNFEFDNLSELVKEVDDNLGFFDRHLNEYINNSEYWVSTQDGVIYTDSPILFYKETGEYEVMTDREFEDWKQGKIKGYMATIWIYIQYNAIPTSEELARDLGIEEF